MTLVWPLTIFSLLLISNTLGDYTAVQVKIICPKTTDGVANIAVRSRSRAHAIAKCKNGNVPLSSTEDHVLYSVTAQLDRSYKGSDCLLHNVKNSGVYSVDVEVWWDSEDHTLIENRTHSLTCEYRQRTLLQPNDVEEWSPSPMFVTPLTSDPARLTLDIVDVQGKNLGIDELSVGRTIMLVAKDISGTRTSFRAHSCQATDGNQSYFMLQSGCGDGYIFNKTSGFKTQGNQASSPLFQSFLLRGSRKLEFRCTFIMCSSNCDGNSCDYKQRNRRSILDIFTSSLVAVTSGPVFLSPLR